MQSDERDLGRVAAQSSFASAPAATAFAPEARPARSTELGESVASERPRSASKEAPDIPGLTGVRGWAALCICIFHYSADRHPGTLYNNLLLNGAFSLYVFFILSGFILAYIYEGWFAEHVSSEKYWRFLTRRLARVYPLHALGLLLWLLCIVVGVTSAGPYNNAYTFALNALLLQAWGFTSQITWDQPSWSISCELLAYFLFPFILLVIRGPLTAIATIVGCVLALQYGLVFRLVSALFGPLTITGPFSYGLPLLGWLLVFMIGVSCFILVRSAKPLALPGWLFDGVAAVGMAWMFHNAVWNDNNGTGALIFCMLLIVGISGQGIVTKALFANRVSVYLGDISYALYLTYIFPVMLFTWSLTGTLHTTWYALPLLPRLFVALLLASLVHHAFEHPMRRFLRKRLASFERRRTRSEGAAVAAENGFRGLVPESTS